MVIQRKRNRLGVFVVVISAVLLTLNLAYKCWIDAAVCAALAAAGASMIVAGMARFTRPLMLLMIGLFLLGSLGHDMPYHRIVGWGLIAMSALLALLDHLMRVRGTPLFSDTEVTHN